jgi:CheY-like chemotaxis protein
MHDISKVRTLVVDDNADWRASVATFLEGEGAHVVDTASRGMEAVRKAQQLQPALILMDINLRDLTGIEATRQIRRLAPASRIVFVSASDEPDVIERALAAGGSAFVSKWRGTSELLTAIDAALDDEVHDPFDRKTSAVPQLTIN